MGDLKDDKPVNKDVHQDDELDTMISSDVLDDLDMPLDEVDLPEDKEATNHLDDLDQSLTDAMDEKSTQTSEENHDIFDELTLDGLIDELEDENRPDSENPSEQIDDSPPQAETSNNVTESDVDTTGTPEESNTESENRRATDKDISSATTDSNAEPETASTAEPVNTQHEQPLAEDKSAASDTSDETPAHSSEGTEDALSKLFDDDLFEAELDQEKPDTDSKQTSQTQQENPPAEKEDAYTLEDVLAEPDDIDSAQLLDLPLDEIEEEPAHTAEKSADALEKDIESLLDSNRVPDKSTNTDSKRSPQKEIDVSKNDLSANSSPENKQATEAPAKKKFGIDLNLVNSITMSLGLIAVLVAVLAVWFGLSASQQADSLKAQSAKLQQQIKLMEEQQKQQSEALEQQAENLQQQLNDLTKVVANKATANWQASHAENGADSSNRTKKSGSKSVFQAKHLKVITPEQKPVILNKRSTKKSTVKSDPPLEVAVGSVKGWIVNLSSMESQKAAIAEVRRLRAKDIKAEFVRVVAKGRVWFRIRISGFANEREAIAYQKYLNEFHSIDSWHHKL